LTDWPKDLQKVYNDNLHEELEFLVKTDSKHRA